MTVEKCHPPPLDHCEIHHPPEGEATATLTQFLPSLWRFLGSRHNEEHHHSCTFDSPVPHARSGWAGPTPRNKKRRQSPQAEGMGDETETMEGGKPRAWSLLHGHAVWCGGGNAYYLELRSYRFRKHPCAVPAAWWLHAPGTIHPSLEGSVWRREGSNQEVISCRTVKEYQVDWQVAGGPTHCHWTPSILHCHGVLALQQFPLAKVLQASYHVPESDVRHNRPLTAAALHRWPCTSSVCQSFPSKLPILGPSGACFLKFQTASLGTTGRWHWALTILYLDWSSPDNTAYIFGCTVTWNVLE